MSYFPFFMEGESQRVLIVGGGEVALRKAMLCEEYGMQIMIVADEVCDQLEQFVKEKGISLQRRVFSTEDIMGVTAVIAATNDSELNHKVAMESKAKNLLVNVVDAPADCNFIMPAVIHKKDITVAISTGGKSPAAASFLKQELKRAIPKHFDRLVESLYNSREYVKEQLKDQESRKKAFDWMLVIGMQNGGNLSKDTVETVVKAVLRNQQWGDSYGSK